MGRIIPHARNRKAQNGQDPIPGTDLNFILWVEATGSNTIYIRFHAAVTDDLPNIANLIAIDPVTLTPWPCIAHNAEPAPGWVSVDFATGISPGWIVGWDTDPPGYTSLGPPWPTNYYRQAKNNGFP